MSTGEFFDEVKSSVFYGDARKAKDILVCGCTLAEFLPDEKSVSVPWVSDVRIVYHQGVQNLDEILPLTIEATSCILQLLNKGV